jgi:hypothetical protein
MDLIVHFGLGDGILCNSIIRYYYKTHNKLNLFVSNNNFKHMNYMFRDLKNLNYVSCPTDKSEELKVSFIGNFTIETSNFYSWYKENEENGLNGLLGQPFLPFPLAYDLKKLTLITNAGYNVLFDKAFYECANLDFEKKWSDFYLERDLDKEKHLYYDILELTDDEDFIFIHDDKTRGYDINKIDTKSKIIRPDNKDFLIFDYLYTIEKAKEVHCMNSSFICLIDTMKLDTGEKFYHRYVRGYNCDPTLKLQWKIID